MNKPSLIIGVAVLAIAVLFGYWFFLLDGKDLVFGNDAPEVQWGKNVEELKTKSLPFAQALQSQKAGDMSEAESRFREALTDASSGRQRGLIMFNLGTTLEFQRKFSEAIQIYKDIVADEEHGLLNRAYAAERMAFMYALYGDPAITPQIFKGDTYADLYVEGNPQLSYRRLYEFASDLYPLGLSQFMIANYYAGALLRISTSDSSDTQAIQASEYRTIIKDRLAKGNEELARIYNSESESFYIRYIVLRKALLLGRLARLGEVPASEAEAAFKEAFDYYRTKKITDGDLRIHNVIFLAHVYGAERLAEIKSVLAPLYAEADKSTPTITYLKNERFNRVNSRADLVKVASLDKDFRALLISLGWQQSDFAQ